MNTKVYRSFDEINKELEILKLERDLSYAKFKRSLNETKESLEPGNIIGDTPKKIFSALSMFSGPLKTAGISWLLRKIF
ncbi:MAG: DUF6327 family protein [Bacteroidia bacterium]|jgi:hypothetical protein